MHTDDTGDTPVLATRFPRGPLPGIEYGAHVSRPSWSGFYVRPAGALIWGITRRLTPALNELAGDDWEVAQALDAELEVLSRERDQGQGIARG